MQRVLTTVTLLGLLVATAAGFAITEHLKQIKSDIYGTRVTPRSKEFSPVCRCPTSKAAVSIRLRHTGRVTVIIVDAKGHEVRTIRSSVLMQAGERRTFPWDGRTDTGTLAPDGVYHPWIKLPRRTYQFTNNIILDATPPEVRSAEAEKRVFFAGAGRTVAINYEFGDKAHALVYLRGRRIILGHQIRPVGKVKWTGRLYARPLRAGRYVLSVGAQDVAGNETPEAKRKQVTVILRYVRLTPERTTVRPGARLAVHVETAARRYTWRLGHRHGARRRRVLRLSAPTTPGTYRLVVSENGHSTTAVVQVRAR